MRLGVLIVVALLAACSATGHVALLSDGALEKKVLSDLKPQGDVIEGRSCGHVQSLTLAFRDAIKETPYDTLVDVDVETTTGVVVWSNCVVVRGKGLDSKTLADKAAVTP